MGIHLSGKLGKRKALDSVLSSRKNGCGYIQIKFYFKRVSSDFSHGPEFPKLCSINVLASLCVGKGLLQKASMAMCYTTTKHSKGSRLAGDTSVNRFSPVCNQLFNKPLYGWGMKCYIKRLMC